MLNSRQAINKIILGDCIEELKNIESSSINLVVTSPPYNLGINYDGYKDDLIWGEYWSFIEKLAIELYRVIKDDGRICINIPCDVPKGKKLGKIDFTYNFKEIFYGVGFKYRDKVYWDKKHLKRKTAWGSFRMPSSPNIVLPFEEIVVLYKKERILKKKEVTMTAEDFKKWVYGHWIIKGRTRKNHPAPFPEELVRRIIFLYSYEGDIVLDPFVGSGTTCIVAQKMNRKYIGIEISETYYKEAIKNLKDVKNTKE